MNVLLTGATGFLGSHLCRRLTADGHTVTAVCRASSDVDGLERLNVRYEIGEVTDAQSMDRVTRGQEVVIHAAGALTSKGSSKRLLYSVNVDGTKNVVRACLRNGIRRLLHVSSVAAIGIPEEPAKPANESFAFNLGSSQLHYHISKYEAELTVRDAVAHGLDSVIVNPTGLYGPAGSFYRGGDIVRQVQRNRILRYPRGGACVVHVEDVIDGLMAALQRGVSGDRYILGGENLTFLQMMQKTAAVLDLKRVYLPVPAAATRLLAVMTASWSAVCRRSFSPAYANYYSASRCSFYDSSKAHRTFGFAARPFEAILEESVRFFKEHSAARSLVK